MPVLCAVAGQARAARRERGGPRRLSARNLPARFCQAVSRRSARVLQACCDTGHGAQDQVGVVLLLSVRELFLVHLLAQRPEGEHLGDGQRVHVRGADADGLAEHVAVLQRPLVAHDALKLVRSMALENHGECGCAGSLLDKVTCLGSLLTFVRHIVNPVQVSVSSVVLVLREFDDIDVIVKRNAGHVIRVFDNDDLL